MREDSSLSNLHRRSEIGRIRSRRVRFQTPNSVSLFQQLTYGVVSEGVLAESLRKFCGKFAETTFYCARKGCGKFAEISRKFAENFLQ